MTLTEVLLAVFLPPVAVLLRRPQREKASDEQSSEWPAWSSICRSTMYATMMEIPASNVAPQTRHDRRIAAQGFNLLLGQYASLTSVA